MCVQEEEESSFVNGYPVSAMAGTYLSTRVWVYNNGNYGTMEKVSVASMPEKAAIAQLQLMVQGRGADQVWPNLPIYKEQSDISIYIRSFDYKMLVINLENNNKSIEHK